MLSVVVWQDRVKTQPIDIKDSALALQAFIKLIKRKCKDPEVHRLGSEAILRFEQLKHQVGECVKDDT